MVSLDNFLQLVHPCLLQVERGLLGGRSLDLAELIHCLCLGDVGSEDVFFCYVIAFFSDLLLGSDHLRLHLESLEDELRDSLCERVLWLWDFDHSIVWSKSLLFSWWQVQRTSDQITTLFKEMLVKDDVVHGLSKVNIHFVEESSGVSRTLASQSLRILGHTKNSIHLIVVSVLDLMLRHVLNVVVVLD